MKQNEIGLQIMPLLLLVSSMAYYTFNNMFLTATCFLLAILMWLVLYGESIKRNR